MEGEVNRLTAVIDKSFLSAIVSGVTERERNRLLDAILGKYHIIVPLVLIEEIVADIARPKNSERTQIALTISRFLCSPFAFWVEDELELVFRELVLGNPIITFPPIPPEIVNNIVALEGNEPELVNLIVRLGQRKHDISLLNKKNQDELLKDGQESVFKTPAEFIQQSVWTLFEGVIRNKNLLSEILDSYFGVIFRKRHPEYDVKIPEALDRYTPTTYKNFPLTTAWLIIHFAYMRGPTIKIGHQKDRAALPYFLGRSKNSQMNNDDDQKYVVIGVHCDRIFTCDKGMKNIAEAFHDSKFWNGDVVYLAPNEINRAFALI